MNTKRRTYRSYLTASAIIASITTSAIAEPKFCTVKKIMRYTLESLKAALRPSISHGISESKVENTRYGILLLPPIGIQSDKILQQETANQIANAYQINSFLKKPQKVLSGCHQQFCVKIDKIFLIITWPRIEF